MDRDIYIYIYIGKMLDMFGDTTTYTVVSRDPTNKMKNDLHNMLLGWKTKKYINNVIYNRLNCTSGVLPRVYDLPKMHKPSCPLRIIISYTNSPLYAFSSQIIVQ